MFFPIIVSAITHKKKTKAPKNTLKNAFKAPQEVDFTVKSTLFILIPFIVIK